MTSTVEQAAPLTPVQPSRPAPRARGRFALVVALLCAAVSLLLYEGLLSSLNYFYTVDEALAHRATLGTTGLRLEGLVVPHTVHQTRLGATFEIAGQDGRTVEVVNTGTPPQLFQPDIPVVVVGHFTSATSMVFDSNQILVKHTANYIAKNPQRVKAPNGSVR